MLFCIVSSAAYTAKMQSMKDVNKAPLRDWMIEVIRQQGSAASWARKAGVAGSTITRFLADADAPTPSTKTLAKLAAVTTLPPPSIDHLLRPSENDQIRRLFEEIQNIPPGERSAVVVELQRALNATVEGRGGGRGGQDGARSGRKGLSPRPRPTRAR
jgi:transcriptional regulator with XRE-family HTH domain